MSDVMSAVPEDHPLMKAWKAHQETADFANSKRWAAVSEHLQGSLWALFMAGFNAGLAEGRRQGLEEAAKWHNEQEHDRNTQGDLFCDREEFFTSREHYRAASIHKQSASAIRALIKEPKT